MVDEVRVACSAVGVALIIAAAGLLLLAEEERKMFERACWKIFVLEVFYSRGR